MKRLNIVYVLAAATILSGCLRAQSIPTAKKDFSLQVGVSGSSYTLDYGEGREEGISIYADVDLLRGFGIEGLYRDASIVTPHDIGENHLLFGPRATFHFKRLRPYAKALVGRATINYQQGYNATAHSQSYFAVAVGGGVDFLATRHISVRLVDAEFQTWPGFPPHGLTPNGLSVGAAYRF